MRGDKIRQVREAALQIIGGLGEGESFNIIPYNQAPDLFSEVPVPKNEESYRAAERYLKGIGVLGGTNIHDALLEALRQKHREGALPIVLFLTDGVPTLGNTSEASIRDLVRTANPHRRRVYTIGVGGDVNAPLLRNLADESRATSAFVLPGEDVEVKVARVFEQLDGPVLADTELSVHAADRQAAPGRVMELMPRRLPDLFENERLTILGKYVGEEPLRFRLSGNVGGREKTFQLSFDLEESTTRNGFVPRLWASRKIGSLVDAIRRKGADSDGPGGTDPEIRELVDEVVRLSRDFGILTEYTAFLAREGTDLSRDAHIFTRAKSNFLNRAVHQRAGWDAVNQGLNISRQQRQTTLNRRNEYLDRNLNPVRTSTVQQINDLAFYRRGARWIDSRLAAAEGTERPDRVVEFGSDAFYALAERLARQNRQGGIALRGEIVLEVDDQTVLVKN
jgi:Ca-activated chloride channel family protein